MDEEIPISYQYLPYFDIVTSILSAISGLVVVMILITLAIFDHKLVDRVSLRFTFAISFVDFLKALVTLAYIFYNTEGPECTAVALFIPILTLMYMFLTMAIAANLQLVFLHGIVFNPKWEYFYWGVSLVFPFVIMAFPLGLGQLGFDRSSGACWYKNSGYHDGFAWVTFTFIIWIILGCIYCTFVVILTIVNLSRKVSIVERISGSELTSDGNGSNKKKGKRPVQIALKRLIRRISLYCLIPIVSQMGYVIETIIGVTTGKGYEFLTWWSILGTGSPGILNLIAFLLDPALYTALKAIKDKKSNPKLHQSLEETIMLPVRTNSILGQSNANQSPTFDSSIGNHYSNNSELAKVNPTFGGLTFLNEPRISELRLVVPQLDDSLAHKQSSIEEDYCQPSGSNAPGIFMTYRDFIKGL